jgi:hypothetical protein
MSAWLIGSWAIETFNDKTENNKTKSAAIVFIISPPGDPDIFSLKNSNF